MSSERLARILVIALVAAAIIIPALAWGLRSQGQVIHARIPENGGWMPEALKAEVGKPLRLRLTSDDVTHGFGLGKSDLQPVDIHPGQTSEVTLNFDKPGTYTFYCTRWCSVNHWRMRGVIEVSDPNNPAADPPAEPVQPPLYIQLGLDIDAEHHADVIPEQMPSARRGAQFGAAVPAAYRSREYYLSHSPLELWKALRNEPALAQLSAQQTWDLAAWIWSENTSSAELEQGRALYAANCATCHGETGRGDGVYADELAGPQSTGAAAGHAGMQTGEMTAPPSDFTDPEHMLAASPAHLQGKLLRGGMGTGMPGWGQIFTGQQTWALVAALWSFQFDLGK